MCSPNTTCCSGRGCAWGLNLDNTQASQSLLSMFLTGWVTTVEFTLWPQNLLILMHHIATTLFNYCLGTTKKNKNRFSEILKYSQCVVENITIVIVIDYYFMSCIYSACPTSTWKADIWLMDIVHMNKADIPTLSHKKQGILFFYFYFLFFGLSMACGFLVLYFIIVLYHIHCQCDTYFYKLLFLSSSS